MYFLCNYGGGSSTSLNIFFIIILTETANHVAMWVVDANDGSLLNHHIPVDSDSYLR
jgi:hypothetical protein